MRTQAAREAGETRLAQRGQRIALTTMLSTIKAPPSRPSGPRRSPASHPTTPAHTGSSE